MTFLRPRAFYPSLGKDFPALFSKVSASWLSFPSAHLTFRNVLVYLWLLDAAVLHAKIQSLPSSAELCFRLRSDEFHGCIYSPNNVMNLKWQRVSLNITAKKQKRNGTTKIFECNLSVKSFPRWDLKSRFCKWSFTTLFKRT